MIGNLILGDLVARGKSGEVAKQWGVITDEFESVCGLKEHYARADIILYLGHLRARGLCQNTINKNLKPIKLLFELLGDPASPDPCRRKPGSCRRFSGQLFLTSA